MLAIRAIRMMRGFCQMKYYKEIASFLKIKVPVLNEEISLTAEVQCVVHGIKKLEQEEILPLTGPSQTLQADGQTQQKAVNPEQELPIPVPPQPLYIYQKFSQEVLPFGKAMAVSKALQMDLSLMRQGKPGIHPILTMSTFRKHVYSEYFLAHIRRRGREGWKHVRLGQRIEDNDVRTKIENVNRMMKAGERRFKLHSLNDSDRSQKVLIEFGKFFGKDVEPYLHTVLNAAKKKEERWSGDLIFDEEVEVDYNQVNKKWRRRQFQSQDRQQQTKHLKNLFQDEDVRMERELYNAYKGLNIQMPAKFQKLAQDQRNIENDRLALYKLDQGEDQQPWDEQEQSKFKEKMDRYNKQFFKERTVTEIIEEMEELKRSGYQSEAHKVARFKQLKQQLQAILKRHENSDI